MAEKLDGFHYIAAGNPGSQLARVGGKYSLPRPGPPFLVVDSHVETILAAKWPGTLWRVHFVPDPSSREFFNGSFRTNEVEFLDQLPLSILFGEHGDAVCNVIAQAESLNRESASRLVAYHHSDADSAYKRAWDLWLQEIHFLNRQATSPINRGFSLIHEIVYRRAVELDGQSVLMRDEEEDEVYLNVFWSTVNSALCCAALALGAPQLCGDADRRSLLTAWREAFN